MRRKDEEVSGSSQGYASKRSESPQLSKSDELCGWFVARVKRVKRRAEVADEERGGVLRPGRRWTQCEGSDGEKAVL